MTPEPPQFGVARKALDDLFENQVKTVPFLGNNSCRATHRAIKELWLAHQGMLVEAEASFGEIVEHIRTIPGNPAHINSYVALIKQDLLGRSDAAIKWHANQLNRAKEEEARRSKDPVGQQGFHVCLDAFLDVVEETRAAKLPSTEPQGAQAMLRLLEALDQKIKVWDADIEGAQGSRTVFQGSWTDKDKYEVDKALDHAMEALETVKAHRKWYKNTVIPAAQAEEAKQERRSHGPSPATSIGRPSQGSRYASSRAGTPSQAHPSTNPPSVGNPPSTKPPSSRPSHARKEKSQSGSDSGSSSGYSKRFNIDYH